MELDVATGRREAPGDGPIQLCSERLDQAATSARLLKVWSSTSVVADQAADASRSSVHRDTDATGAVREPVAHRVADQFGDDQARAPAAIGIQPHLVGFEHQPDVVIGERGGRHATADHREVLGEVHALVAGRRQQGAVRLGVSAQTARGDVERQPCLGVCGPCRQRERGDCLGILVDDPVADLLDILKITKQSLARVLRQLIDNGYIEQKTGDSDRRQRLLHATDKGRRFFETLSATQTSRIEAAIAALPDEGKRTVLRFFVGMVEPGDRPLLDRLKLTDDI